MISFTARGAARCVLSATRLFSVNLASAASAKMGQVSKGHGHGQELPGMQHQYDEEAPAEAIPSRSIVTLARVSPAPTV
jgi:hypothetical protein